jgi:FkbM family methyltransferase
VPENFALLKENLAMNGITNVIAYPYAVSDKTGTKELHMNAANTGGHSFYGEGEAKNVGTISLADLMQLNGLDRIDFLKMDCEGAEYEILFGCPASVLSRIGRIAMEYHNLGEGRNCGAMTAFLERNGFKVHGGAQGMIYAVREP